jgi:hypothetical protein
VDQRGHAEAGETAAQMYVSRALDGKHCASGTREVAEGIAVLCCWQLDTKEGATACVEFGGRGNRRLGGEAGDVGRDQGQEGVLVLRWRSHDGGVRVLEWVSHGRGRAGRLMYASGGCCGG